MRHAPRSRCQHRCASLVQDWNVIYKAMNQLYEKRFDESLMAFGQALTAFPEFEPMILSYRSLAFLALDRVQAARTDAESVIHSYPKHPVVRIGLCSMRCSLARFVVASASSD